MRTTSDLDADLHKQAQASSAALPADPRTGLPVVRAGKVVTSEDVRSLEDEE